MKEQTTHRRPRSCFLGGGGAFVGNNETNITTNFIRVQKIEISLISLRIEGYS